jgi:nitrite reductase/ring-hydroxylating ferredoxin subunit
VDEWLTIAALDDLPDGKGTRVSVDGFTVMVVRSGEDLFAIADRCTHQGASLHRGPVKMGSAPSVTCPAHGSVFRLDDGRVLRGPASAPVEAYEARVVDGQVQIRPRD